MSKVISDPIYGGMILNDTEVKLISRPEFLRLKRIKHLGFVDLVYPGATHTRDSHGLGVANLVRKVGEYIGLDEVTIEMLRVAALLHDVGHGPFSHESDPILNKYSDTDHEEISAKLIKTKFSELISERGLSPKTIADIVTGERGPFYDLIRGHFDVDYIDCLTRDAYYTGAKQGFLDVDRLCKVIRFVDNKLVIMDKGKAVLEAFFVSKHLMFSSVYHHHVTEIAKTMFQKALEKAILDGKVDAKQAWRFDDAEMSFALKNAGGLPSKMMKRIEERQLYKRLLWLKKSDVDDIAFSKLMKCQDRKILAMLEKEVSERCNLEEGELLIDISSPPERALSEGETSLKFLMNDGSLKPVEEVSPIIKALKEAQWDLWKVGVYVPKEKLSVLDPSKVWNLIKSFEPVKLSDYI